MIVVPPIEQFTNSYLVTTPGSEPISFTNYINVIVEKEQLDGLRVDYNEVSRHVSERDPRVTTVRVASGYLKRRLI